MLSVMSDSEIPIAFTFLFYVGKLISVYQCEENALAKEVYTYSRLYGCCNIQLLQCMANHETHPQQV
mgnify:CR=1 FL=1